MDAASGNKRRQAAVVLALGVALIMLAGILAWRNGSTEPSLAAGNDAYAVAKLVAADNDLSRPEVGSLAPNFVIASPNAPQTTLADYHGQPVMLNFWATWCPPCRQEMPEIERAYEAYRDQGLVVLAINVAESPQKVDEFVQAFGMTMPVVIDAGNVLLERYDSESLPTSVFIDKNGRITAIWRGFIPRDDLIKNLEGIL